MHDGVPVASLRGADGLADVVGFLLEIASQQQPASNAGGHCRLNCLGTQQLGIIEP